MKPGAHGKIFGIGLNKTATRSLASALRILGYRTLHKGDDATSELVDRAVREGLPMLTYIGHQYDAYLDVAAIVRNFAALDEQYPGSKFILTTTAEDDWLSSRERHVLANRERAARGEYSGRWLDVDLDGWRTERTQHHEAVLSHFADRPADLLVLSITSGDGWEQLAPFLGCDIPRRSFPWENREGAGTYKAESALRILRRRGNYLSGRVRRMASRRRRSD